MSKFYYFEAKGTGTDPKVGGDRENWMMGFQFGLGAILTNEAVRAVNKDQELIRKSPRNPRYYLDEDLTVVKAQDWDCPDLGRIQPHSMSGVMGCTSFVDKMKPGMEKYFMEVVKPDGNPTIANMVWQEGLGIVGCMYEIKPGTMSFKPREPEKEKKSLFNW